MIEHDDIEAGIARGRQRVGRRGAAIDRDDEAAPSSFSSSIARATAHSLPSDGRECRRAARTTQRREEIADKRRRTGTVDIVIAEHRDLLAALDAARARATALSMSLSDNGSGRSRFSVGLRYRRPLRRDAARRQQPRQHGRDIMRQRESARAASSSASRKIQRRPEKGAGDAEGRSPA
jgi:hypothetical protein